MPESYDPRLVLIGWLISRTERSRVSWKIEDDNLIASVSLPPLVHLRFAGCTQAAGQREQWDSFSLRGQGFELFQIDSNHSNSADPAVFGAANALFLAAMKSRDSN